MVVHRQMYAGIQEGILSHSGWVDLVSWQLAYDRMVNGPEVALERETMG
jgi:hypothetical protein